LLDGLLRGFGYVALFVAIFVIYNTFSLIVTQRTRELALLRALGAGRGQIIGSMAMEAAVVGAVAAAMGLAAGVLFAWLIEVLLTRIGLTPINTALVVESSAFVPAFVVGTVVTIVAALFPAWRASHTAPVVALRDHEVEPATRTPVRALVGGAIALVGAVLL